jgi:phosphate/sulfate permease
MLWRIASILYLEFLNFLVMKRKTWLTAVLFAVPWTLFMIIYNALLMDGISTRLVVSTVIGGAIAGFLFSLSMEYFANRMIKGIQIEVDTNEEVVMEAGANHFKGKEGVGGKLVLTNKRLIFKSHKYNIQNHQESYDLASIRNASATKTLGFLKNGLLLQVVDQPHRFVVDNPTDWINSIYNQQKRENVF